tara:strand:+ start:705 stop:1130 length:426 start_codon:yes stop_codon:yes gene_type:complete
MYQNKETMKTGVSVMGLRNINTLTSKEIIDKLKHLSVPMGLYSNPYVKRVQDEKNSLFYVSKIDNMLDREEVIPDELFQGLLNITTSRDKSKTRKNKINRKIKKTKESSIKIKINTVARRGKQLTKKRSKPRRRVTKKALK